MSEEVASPRFPLFLPARRFWSVLSFSCLALFGSHAITAGAEDTPVLQSGVTASNGTASEVSVYFSPQGGCTEACISAISEAKKTIHAQAYSFTSAPIAKALVEAHKRGVSVILILDKSQKTANYSSADFLARAGIPTFIDAKHAIAHNKIMIVDGGTVLTGSFNFTKAAESSNAENLLVIRDAKLAARYLENWNEHFAHSEGYSAK